MLKIDIVEGLYVRISPPVEDEPVPPAGYVALVCIYLFAGFFQWGWGPVSNALPSIGAFANGWEGLLDLRLRNPCKYTEGHNAHARLRHTTETPRECHVNDLLDRC